MNKQSILSDYDAVSFWLNTPVGYFIDKPEFGNNLDILLYKTEKEISRRLPFILDKLEDDMGSVFANQISEISLLKNSELDNYMIVIVYNNTYAVKEIK